MTTLINTILATLILTSCRNVQQSCDVSAFQKLEIPPGNAVLLMPPYLITDTLRYGDKSNIFQYEVISKDSSIIVHAGVKSYEHNPGAMPAIDQKTFFIKNEMIFGQAQMELITEKFRIIDSTKVVLIKYHDIKRQRLEARIFYNYGKRFVDIALFEEYAKSTRIKHSIIDCIFESIHLGRPRSDQGILIRTDEKNEHNIDPFFAVQY